MLRDYYPLHDVKPTFEGRGILAVCRIDLLERRFSVLSELVVGAGQYAPQDSIDITEMKGRVIGHMSQTGFPFVPLFFGLFLVFVLFLTSKNPLFHVLVPQNLFSGNYPIRRSSSSSAVKRRLVVLKTLPELVDRLSERT